MAFDESKNDGVVKVTEAANQRFGCAEKANSFLNAPQPAFFGETNNRPIDQARLGNVQTVLHMLKPAGGC